MDPLNPTAQLLLPEVGELIREGRYGELREALHGIPAVDVADILAALEPAEAAVAFRFLMRDDAGEAFAYLSAEKQEALIRELGAEASVRVVEAMEPDDRARLIEELPPEVARRLISSLSPEKRRVTQAILGYPPKSVGRLMTPDYVKVRPEWTIAHALEHIRKTGRDAETVNFVYVVDDQGRLVDDVRLRQLLFAEPEQTVESLLKRQFVALRADQDQEAAVRAMSRYDRSVLPVVDSRDVLLGIVTSDDVADVAEAEATEDIQKLAGMGALEDPYMDARILELFRKRGVWLSLLFVGQSITILVLGAFIDQLGKAVVLAMFMPLVISCGGNSGAQAATLVIRALALGEVRPVDWVRVVSKELVSGALLGMALAVLGVLIVEFFSLIGVVPAEVRPHSLWLGITVATAVLTVVIWGTTLGGLLPLALRRLGFDPAAASTPMVATLMDASGTLIYFGLAVLMLRGTVIV
ncbi:MAG: magnesium transporter [Phycisphaerales bacterium]